MTPDEKILLQKLSEMTEENNDMLKGIRRSMRLSRLWSIIYWALIIGSSVGVYYLIQPYINQLLSIYSGAGEDIKNAKNILNSIR